MRDSSGNPALRRKALRVITEQAQGDSCARSTAQGVMNGQAPSDRAACKAHLTCLVTFGTGVATRAKGMWNGMRGTPKTLSRPKKSLQVFGSNPAMSLQSFHSPVRCLLMYHFLLSSQLLRWNVGNSRPAKIF